MTATSGPGFLPDDGSGLFRGHVRDAFPDRQRAAAGSRPGYITSSQEDVMQARWGHHGGGSIIALAPSSVQEMFDFTIQAYNYAEEWRVPVILLADETVAHMREKLTVPPWDKVKVVNRIKPQTLGMSPKSSSPMSLTRGRSRPCLPGGTGTA